MQPGVPRLSWNHRIRKFLKDLTFAQGHSTGISKIMRAMKDNGSAYSRPGAVGEDRQMHGGEPRLRESGYDVTAAESRRLAAKTFSASLRSSS